MLNDIVAFHAEVDALAERLGRAHAGRLQCRRGCSGCCVDDIRVFEIEARLIEARHPAVLQSAPHPEGACAFLDAEGACRVYESRPYVCRTQGLPLRWIEGDVEMRDVCALNEAPDGWNGPLITELAPGACWTIGPAEAKLSAIAAAHGAAGRIRLRDLFAPTPFAPRT